KFEFGDKLNGFTLMEFLVVLAIEAMGFGIIVGSFGDRSEEMILGRVAHRIRTEHYSAQLEAIQSGQVVTLSLNLATCTFVTEINTREFDCSKGLFLTQLTDGNETLSPVWRVTYFEDGTVTGSTLNLKFGEQTVLLEFSLITGLVQITTIAF
ncbi:MAG: prepilin-type N-terminal cleavage/methylation domain-containing protein, partial [Aliivibrio sp.]|uniref:pilus assembly FimT family protein n=1 Tax=Aliivibrio sp. TaxID=1872443 RepID=UPI001A6371EA|nr:prepilin-type N-terminal cleavage/methylation domain-containing protein [Aliivibrio sp.]